MADIRKPDPGNPRGDKSHFKASLRAVADADRRWNEQTVEQKNSRFTATPTVWPQECDCGLHDGPHLVRSMQQYQRHNMHKVNNEIIGKIQTSGRPGRQEATHESSQEDTRKASRKASRKAKVFSEPALSSDEEDIRMAQARSKKLRQIPHNDHSEAPIRQPPEPSPHPLVVSKKNKNKSSGRKVRFEGDPPGNDHGFDGTERTSTRPFQAVMHFSKATTKFNDQTQEDIDNFDAHVEEQRRKKALMRQHMEAEWDGRSEILADSVCGTQGSQKSMNSTIVVAIPGLADEDNMPDLEIVSEEDDDKEELPMSNSMPQDQEDQEDIVAKGTGLIRARHKKGAAILRWMEDIKTNKQTDRDGLPYSLDADQQEALNNYLSDAELSDDNVRNGRSTMEEMDAFSDDGSVFYSDDTSDASDISELAEERENRIRQLEADKEAAGTEADNDSDWEDDWGYKEAVNQPLEDRMIVSLGLLDIKRQGNLSIEGLRDTTNLFRVIRPDLAPYDWRTTDEYLGNRTGVQFERFDVCRNNCFCFAAAPKALNCPLCGEARYKPRTKKAFVTFDYIPLIHRLRLQYANYDRAKTMHDYKARFYSPQTDPKIAPVSPEDEALEDFWNSDLHKEYMDRGMLLDPKDIAFVFGTDGFQVFKIRVSKQCWPLLLVNMNLPPDIRYKHEEILTLGVIPGPKEPVDFNSFLVPLVKELRQLQTGIPNVYNGYTKEYFTLKSHLVIFVGDMKAREKVMAVSGCGSYSYCTYCKCRGFVRTNTKKKTYPYCAFTRPHDWRASETAGKARKRRDYNARKRRQLRQKRTKLHTPGNRSQSQQNAEGSGSDVVEEEWEDEADLEETVIVKYDVRNLPPKTHAEYMDVMKDLLRTLDFDQAALFGVRGFSILSLLDSVDFPRSFPPGGMHQWYNLFRHLFNWYRGKFRKTAKGKDPQFDEAGAPVPADENEEDMDTGVATFKSLLEKIENEFDDTDEEDGLAQDAPTEGKGKGKGKGKGNTKAKADGNGKDKAKNTKEKKFVQTDDLYCIKPSDWERIGNDMAQTAKEGLIPSAFGIQIRSITDHSHEMKAEEWENWAMRYSPIYLHTVLAEPFYSEYVRLVDTVRISKQRTITRKEIGLVKEGMARFLDHYEEHYYQYKTDRLDAMKPSIHQVGHVAQFLALIGPSYVSDEVFVERTCGMYGRGCKQRNNIYRNIALNCLRAVRFSHFRFTFSIDELRKEAGLDKENPIVHQPGTQRPLTGLEGTLADMKARHGHDDAFLDDIKRIEGEIRKQKEAMKKRGIGTVELIEEELEKDLGDGKALERQRLCAWYYEYLLKTAKLRGLDTMLPSCTDYTATEDNDNDNRPSSFSKSIPRFDTQYIRVTGKQVRLPLSRSLAQKLEECDPAIPASNYKDLMVIKHPNADFWDKDSIAPDLCIASSSMPRENRTRSASFVLYSFDMDQPRPHYHVGEVLYIFTIKRKSEVVSANSHSDSNDSSGDERRMRMDTTTTDAIRAGKYALITPMAYKKVPGTSRNVYLESSSNNKSKDIVVSLDDIRELVGFVICRGRMYLVNKKGNGIL